ncbi:hypothetical protein [Desulfobacula phenolica]|uniref:Uncharacterized protein n=1 Tax=Desulfobacula phenolica TaxID=90732 RepID=A0A1H2I3Z1_9BACT|nr:hypothetical protein [Desulfobacula phenolica]SDU38616.1 hypothetical protein SAMN04487931_107211 [Desulfobacula phenolica]
MVNSTIVVVVAEAKEKAAQGVDFSPRYGAVCPECGEKRLKVITSKPWKDGCKIRYHRCTNLKKGCLLAIMETTIKSVQTGE